MKAALPEPSADARAVSLALNELIVSEIRDGGGWIPFSRYWELALYTPGLGYYSGGAVKFGSDTEGGDFVTAPELTPLFGQALAHQVAQVLEASDAVVLEAGAGSGKLAADLLNALGILGKLPRRYLILELSGELRSRQRTTLEQIAPAFADRVEWLDALPEVFSGCVVGNEVLDAMPVNLLRWSDGIIEEGGVSLDNGGKFVTTYRTAPDTLIAAAHPLPVAGTYLSELSLAARAWTAEWGHRLERGAVLLLDYGLPRHEYYHPQRNGGTVRCHYRHRSHDDPYWWPGLCDITAHVDFTAIAESAHDAGMDVLGYTTQATFLLNCGIAELLSARQQEDAAAGAIRAGGAVNLLLSPNEMGELFKVIALGKELAVPLLGFRRGDRTHTL